MSHVDGRTLTGSIVVDTDVAVVGSGPAGSAFARVLAQAGARVVVLEAGPWVHPEAFELPSFRAMAATYRGLGGTMALGRTATPLVQGRMVGGSSPINGAICWRMPRDVHDAWLAEDPALVEQLSWEALEQATDEIEARWNVQPTDPAVAGRKNALMAIGAEALGIEHRPIRRNVEGCVGLGRCLQGCPHGAKLSADRTLLQDATEHGATVYSSAEATHIGTHRGRATHVEARTPAGGRLTVRARHAVVVAASAVQSPALLLRSGLHHGPVGHGFQGHPGVALSGRFPEPVNPWHGATQGHEVIGLRHEGLKFEVLSYDLTLIAARMSGVGASLAHQVHDAAHWATWGAAVKSGTRGRVRVVLGKTWVTWSPSPQDIRQYRRALRWMGEMMLAAGADHVSPGVRGVAPQLGDVHALRALERDGPSAPSAYRSVMTHLFGTCRMGSDPARAVVRPDFRHHTVEGLYVVDSSVFPTNLGVNPQVSIAAVATLAGRSALAGAR